MTDSDDLMDVFPGFSIQCHKRDHFEEKKKKGRRNFFGDYLTVSFVKIPRMNAGPCMTTV